jgi:flagellin-like protein
MDTRQLREDRTAVVPVIGVILMIAVTVVLAAVVGTFVVDRGNAAQKHVQAGVSVDCDGAVDEVTVTWIEGGNADSLTVDFGGDVSDAGNALRRVSDSVSTTAASDGDTVRVTVTANAGGRSALITTEQCDL